MKFLTDLLPVLLFFIAYKFFGIYVATAVAIVTAAIQIGYNIGRGKKIDKMQWITLGLLAFFGGMTLIFRDPTFIKWKPTIINWGFALAVFGSSIWMKQSLIEKIMGQAVILPKSIWQRLNISWILFFLLLGGLNLIVAYQFDEATWVNFKLFGLMGLTFVFVIIQSVYIGRHAIPESTSTS